MRPLTHLAAFLCLGAALCPSASAAGIVTGFVPGAGPGREILSHVEVKGLVAEFLDPGNTGLGKSLGYLLWREVLTAISDQAGAGVILARAPGETRLTELLRRDYHRAAVEVARAQQARMVLWGAVQEVGDRLYVNAYLTLLPEVVGADLQLSLTAGPGEQALPGFTAEIPRERYNFEAVATSRESLFRRPLVARSDLEVLRVPESGAGPLARAAAGQVLQAEGMEGAWFRVRLGDGTAGWVENTRVEVPPAQVAADLASVQVRAAPNGAVLFTTRLRGTYPVLDQRFVAESGTWYRLDLGARSGWVAAWLVEPRFSLPAVPFMAGLYRYQRRNFGEAAKAFGAFLRQAGEAESSANRSSAHQFVGASLLNQRGMGNSDALQAMDRAAALTPYDPAVYNLRALTRLGVGAAFTPTVADVNRALELDGRNVRSRTLLTALDRLADPTKADLLPLRDLTRPSPADAAAVRELKVRFEPPRVRTELPRLRPDLRLRPP